MVKNSRFFGTFGPPCRNPLAKVDGSMPEFEQVCALHARLHLATLRKTETAAGRVAIGVSRQTGITSHFGPVEPRERWVHTHATVG